VMNESDQGNQDNPVPQEAGRAAPLGDESRHPYWRDWILRQRELRSRPPLPTERAPRRFRDPWRPWRPGGRNR
jgi:hypothetical protein